MAEDYLAKADRAEAESRDAPEGRTVPEIKEDELGG